MAYTKADLEAARRHVSRAERHVVQQERILGDLKRAGFPTDGAERLLATFSSVLRTHREQRHKIEATLG